MQTTRLLLERGNKNWCFEILKDYITNFTLGHQLFATKEKKAPN